MRVSTFPISTDWTTGMFRNNIIESILANLLNYDVRLFELDFDYFNEAW